MYSRQPITWRTKPSTLGRSTRCSSACATARSTTCRGSSRPTFSSGLSTEWNSHGSSAAIASS